MGLKCLIQGCGNTHDSVQMHYLPKDPEIRKKWCNVINRPDLEAIAGRQRYHFRVCDLHFADDAKFIVNRNRTNLKCDAVPSLHLRNVSNVNIPGTSRDGSMCAVPALQMHDYCKRTPEHPKCEDASTSSEASGLVSEQSSLETKTIALTVSSTPHRPKHGSLRPKLLKSVGVRRANDLTPKARKLYEVAKDLKKVARRLDYQNTSNKERITEALNFAESTDFSKFKLNERSLNFINCQLKMSQKKPRGRRFTFDDKIFAFSLLKQSPKAYKVLRSTFVLPSRKTLMSLLNKIHFQVGIVPNVMEVLKHCLEKMEFMDRHCVLMFVEISLESALTYDKKWDEIIGFENVNGHKKLKFADHALVFMVQGIHKKWKQPISFHFSQGGMCSDELKILIKDTILKLQEIGFIIVSTVCDQYPANVNAIKKLKVESPQPGPSDIDLFQIGEQEIVAIYDPPHLLKGLRKNLVANDVAFTMKNNKMKASWDHILKLYELDEGDFNTRMCYKLIDSHIYKEKLKKIKVKHAAQVFSHQVSSTMRWTVKYGREGIIPTSATETADFLSFVDQLFDSVNGSSYEADHGKTLRCAVRSDSAHVE